MNFFTKLFGHLITAYETHQQDKENKTMSNINIEPGKQVLMSELSQRRGDGVNRERGFQDLADVSGIGNSASCRFSIGPC